MSNRVNMKTNALLLFLFVFLTTGISAQNSIYSTRTGEIYFISDAPLEVIEASSNTLAGKIDASNNTFAFSILIQSFDGFNSPLQRQHFNENYMESHKYKVSVFKGKIVDEVDFTKDGTYEVTAKGTLDIHGVTVEREIKGTLTISNGKINLTTEFDVALKDHKIKIPSVVVKNIAEVVKVTVNINFAKK